MKKKNYIGKYNCWITRQQELLLKASLLHGQDSIDAWSQWRSEMDFSAIDAESTRLLPLLYLNCRGQFAEDSVMNVCRGMYKRTWYANQIRLSEAAVVLEAFNREGIETLFLKGAALALVNYKTLGSRPMRDVDILVSRNQARLAMDVMKGLGWSIGEADYTEERALKNLHAIEFQRFNAGVRSFAIDLHWNIMFCSKQRGADDDFWDGAVSVNLSNVPTLVLNPTDQLLHICLRGARNSQNAYSHASSADLMWVADAIQILSSSDIDWDRMVDQAQKLSVGLQLQDAFYFLEKVLGVQLPLEAIEKIDAIPNTRMARIHRALTLRSNESKYFKIFLRTARRSLRWTPKTGQSDKV